MAIPVLTRKHHIMQKKSDAALNRVLHRALVVVLSLSFCMAATGSVFAGVVSFDDTQTLPSNVNTTLTLGKFDTSLGTLTNVWVQLEVRLNDARVQLDNDAALAQTGTGQVLNVASPISSTVTLLKFDGVNFDSINAGDLGINVTQLFNLSATTGDAVGFTATNLGDYADWQPGTLTAGDSGNIFNGVWGGYQGTGNFTITVNSAYLAGATFNGNDGYFQGNTTNGTLYGKVVYTYAAVPEPSTLVLLALGTVGLAVFARRRAA
jgi:hypothetical protein